MTVNKPNRTYKPNHIYLSVWEKMMREKAEAIIMGEEQEEEFRYGPEEAETKYPIIYNWFLERIKDEVKKSGPVNSWEIKDESGRVVGEVSVEPSEEYPEGFVTHWVYYGENPGESGREATVASQNASDVAKKKGYLR
ncbi:hypothetical protein PP914_gp217 [Arthrobacter phage Qui]|uniref:Uncharacterized protein n=1 Tax=Arthrobacter phage Qui TaxID=2603260 RepID=A0A5B8WKU2_9CAUD|nr:hypothetical protein PP914_gp217 [Arthrobacter phage Qui]QED11705.1 hypothetical protein SEA_QUI_217 [Arthrobacter phage Qui]